MTLTIPYILSSIAILYLLLTGSQCTEVTESSQVASARKVSAQEGNFSGGLNDGDNWGAALSNIGDLEGDGVVDLAVGAPGDDDNGDNRGAVWILFLNADGSVDISTKIADNSGGFNGDLDDNDRFGSALAGIGDLNGDGARDLVVGAPMDDDGGDDRGALWVLFLNANGTVTASSKISDQSGGLPSKLDDGDQFGAAVTDLGDLDGDGIRDLAVGAPLRQQNGAAKGSVWILFMNANGSVRAANEIGDGEGKFKDSLDADDRFGAAVPGLGDLDGDGIPDLAVGAPQHDAGGSNRGAVWILLMNRDGSVKDQRMIAQDEAGFSGRLADDDRFGSALVRSGDLDGDGVRDLAVGAPMSDDGAGDSGAIWLLFMKANGKVKGEAKISQQDGKFKENLNSGDNFGAALTDLGNLDNERSDDLAVGAPFDDDDHTDAGALYMLFMERTRDEKRVSIFSN